ncbi:MAG: hypothetical protein ACR2RE_19530, partial [Geminicoccaceae bacterium]
LERNYNYGSCYHDILVEIKPNLSDDFPSVLRQIKARRPSGGVKILFIRSFSFEKVTLDQVREIFAASGIRIVLEKDVDAILQSKQEGL